MKSALIKRLAAFFGMASLSNALAAQGGTAPSPKMPYVQRPPAPDPGPPSRLLFNPILSPTGWNYRPSTNQRRIRKARRQAHANGKKNAFA